MDRWLPEHPGGKSIIPEQALNMDAARMFEIYHSGREPFMFLQQFYIGTDAAHRKKDVVMKRWTLYKPLAQSAVDK